MKTLILAIAIVLISSKANAQTVNKIYNISLAEQEITNLRSALELMAFKALRVFVSPQSGSLFAESYKYVKGISNLRMLFNDYDLAFKIGIEHKLLNSLMLSSVYNVGVLKFDGHGQGTIPGSNIKIVLKYNF